MIVPLILLLAGPAQVPAAPAITGIRFELLLTDGTTTRGHLTRLLLGPDGRGAVTLVDEAAREVPWDRVVKLVRQGGPAPRPLAEEVLWFVDGDALRGSLRSGDADSLEFLPALAPAAPVRVPVPRLLGVRLAPSADPLATADLRATVTDRAREGESVWLTNGDRRPWSFTSIDAGTVRLESDAGPVQLDRPSVAALAFDPALADRPPAPGPHLEALLADGSRLSLAGVTLDDGQLQVQTRAGVSLRVPAAALLELYPQTGPVAFVDTLEPAALDFVPYLDRHPGRLGRGTTWDSAPLSVRGRTHAHGLGMLPRTLVAYRLQPGDRRFQATLAVDDRAGDQASVVYRILLDRREAYASPPLTRRSDPVPVDLELGDARLLVLIAEFGERGDVHDHADWLDARILRDPPRP